MRGVKAKALFDTLADQVAEAKAQTPCITLADIKPVVLINTLVQMESDTLGDTVGS